MARPSNAVLSNSERPPAISGDGNGHTQTASEAEEIWHCASDAARASPFANGLDPAGGILRDRRRVVTVDAVWRRRAGGCLCCSIARAATPFTAIGLMRSFIAAFATLRVRASSAHMSGIYVGRSTDRDIGSRPAQAAKGYELVIDDARDTAETEPPQ